MVLPVHHSGAKPGSGAYRSTDSCSTLEYRAVDSSTPSKTGYGGSLSDYMSQTPCMAKPAESLMKWVQVRGPHLEACDASGCEVQLTHMWHLMKNRDHHKEDILKLKHQYELRQQQVLKVKQIQTNKYGPDHPKMLELDAWATDKLKVELAKIAEVEKHLDNVESKISIYVEQVVAKFEKPDPDPDCDALLVEVESLFSNMSLSEQTNPETKESVAMDATSHALEKVQALPDGPEKSAMTAVLQAAVPSQVRDYFKFSLYLNKVDS